MLWHHKACSLLIWLIAPSALLGATFPATSLEHLFLKAEVVVRGTVLDVRSRVLDAKTSTIVQLSVTEQWKGHTLRTIEMTQPGGQTDVITEAIPGVPTFRAGDDVILFLDKDEEDSYVVLSGKQGRLLVRPTKGDVGATVEAADGTSFDLSVLRARLSQLSGAAKSQ